MFYSGFDPQDPTTWTLPSRQVPLPASTSNQPPSQPQQQKPNAPTFLCGAFSAPLQAGQAAPAPLFQGPLIIPSSNQPAPSYLPQPQQQPQQSVEAIEEQQLQEALRRSLEDVDSGRAFGGNNNNNNMFGGMSSGAGASDTSNSSNNAHCTLPRCPLPHCTLPHCTLPHSDPAFLPGTPTKSNAHLHIGLGVHNSNPVGFGGLFGTASSIAQSNNNNNSAARATPPGRPLTLWHLTHFNTSPRSSHTQPSQNNAHPHNRSPARHNNKKPHNKPAKQICRAFEKTGHCRYGDRCRNYHQGDSEEEEEEDGRGSDIERDSQSEREEEESDDDREICRFFERTGRCKYGDRCYYSHDVTPIPDRKHANNNNNNKRANQNHPSSTNQKSAVVCRDWRANGRCRFGNKCRFSHCDNNREDRGKQQGGESKEEESEKECVVCMTHKKDVVIIPCGHICMCEDCAYEVDDRDGRCPICRGDIEEIMKVFA